jgi:putative tricarboxylic transport membrane protein
MAKRSSLGLALLIMVLSAWGIYSALGWPLKAKLFPIVISIPLFCLAAAEVLWGVFGKDDAAHAAVALPDDPPRELERHRTLLAAGWIAGFFLLILLLGFPIAVPAMVLAYLKWQGKERWIFSLVFTAAVWFFFYGLFELLLHLHFPEGWLL